MFLLKSSFALYVCFCSAQRAVSWTDFSVIAPLTPHGCFFESDTNVITEGSLLLLALRLVSGRYVYSHFYGQEFDSFLVLIGFCVFSLVLK